LYQPYLIEQPATKKPRQNKLAPALIFRDHVLSDRIGFAYQYMSAHDAAHELVYRLHRIRERIADMEHSYLVSIILDGENAWESYEDNGDPFFRELYTAISNDSWLRTVTVTEYLRENPPRAKIKRLASGSWINGNFDTWIGEPAQNRAWELLAQTREALALWQRDYALADEEVISRAWDELYIAEGSDWFWWYSSHNNSIQNAMFDELFRGHLQNVYSTIGLPVPDGLKEQIRKYVSTSRARGITAPISPQLSGDEIVGPEWDGAGIIESGSSTGTMQHAETNIARVFYGYDSENVYFRIESNTDLALFRIALYLSVLHGERYNTRPRFAESDASLELNWEISIDPASSKTDTCRADGQQIWKRTAIENHAKTSGRIAEIAISRHGLALGDDTIGFLVSLDQDHRLVETVPKSGIAPLMLTRS
jgi:alpha-amylase/alpha-mannosidase (GH57 family)